MYFLPSRTTSKYSRTVSVGSAALAYTVAKIGLAYVNLYKSRIDWFWHEASNHHSWLQLIPGYGLRCNMDNNCKRMTLTL